MEGFKKLVIGILVVLGLYLAAAYIPVGSEYVRIKLALGEAAIQCSRIIQGRDAAPECAPSAQATVRDILGHDPASVELSFDKRLGTATLVCQYDRPITLPGLQRTLHIRIEGSGQFDKSGFGFTTRPQ